jgi:hypothetical protein
MKFKINVDEVMYDVETLGSTKLNYLVKDGKSSYEITLNASGEWIMPNFYGEYPVPVDRIGEAIQAHFGP